MDFRTRGLKISKSIILIAYCVVVFFLAVFIISGFMNRGNTDMTVEMSEANLPVVSFKYGSYEYNSMYGFTSQMDVSMIRDHITPLNDGRKLSLVIDKYGNTINKISYELRTTDGERLIENTEIFNYVNGENTVTADITLKDLIYKDTEYSLCIILETNKNPDVRYYTKIIDSDNLALLDKLKFTYEFSDTCFDKVKAQEMLPTYIESDKTGDNSSFSYVNIHSSLNQITYGALNPEKVTKTLATIKKIDEKNAIILLDYFVKTTDNDVDTLYRVDEKFNISLGKDRVFLMNYEREMEESFAKDTGVLANNKIVLGIMNKDVNRAESPDGNRLVFENDGRLYTYNITDNKLAYVFGFYEGEVNDGREINKQHKIKIFNIDEIGNVYFMVYGYMNRGTHEGQMGSAIYYYDSVLNTVEELLYIQTNQSFDILMNSMEEVAYVNGQSLCFLMYDGILYRINLETGNESKIAENLNISNYVINKEGSKLAWVDNGGEEYGERIIIYDFESVRQIYVNASEDSMIRPIGFFTDDLIYGEALNKDICRDISEKLVFPMNRIVIRNESKIIKEYQDPGSYIINWDIQDTLLNLYKTTKVEADGSYIESSSDQIMNNASPQASRNTIETAVTDRYETIVQIAMKKEIDAKTLQILTPKQVILEKNKEVNVKNAGDNIEYYYAYSDGEFLKVFTDEKNAVKAAYDNNGMVVRNDGRVIYKRHARIAKNQIMAITGNTLAEGDTVKDTVAVCLETILNYEGLSADVRADIKEGKTVANILKENITDAEILELTGCPLDVVLDYVEKDYPVLAYTSNSEAVVLVGYNEYNTVLMNPETGTVYKYGINDSKEMFEKAGNRFVTYIKFKD